MSTQDEIRDIKEKIRQLEALKDAGAMPEDLADASIAALRAQLATYQAQVNGGGAAAQGPNASAVGKQGVGIGGNATNNNIYTGDTHIHLGEDASDPAALETAYLTTLMAQAGQLSLEGIDPQAASEAEKRLSLGAVYTALLTLSPEAHDRVERGEMAAREARRRSALEELNEHPHLVLLGDPGSGKTTFVNFLSLCLAGERLGHQTLNLKTLTAPLPDDDGDDEDHPQSWRHGALLPVRVILRDFAARGLPPEGKTVTVEHLWAFLKEEMEAQGLAEYLPHLRRRLRKKGGIFLFDGLDEVPAAEETGRRAQIIQLVKQVKTAFPKCRVLVTSRTYAYRRQDWTLDGFEAAVLAPFSRGQILRFVDRWYAHIAQLREMDAADAQGRAELLKHAIFANPRLQALAERPLLLTLMASLHAWRGGSLPEKREQLYNDTVDLLLDWWERRRVVREKDGTVRLMQPSLAEYLNVGKDRIRKLLNRLAYEAHAGQPDLQGTADIPEDHLVEGLLGLTEKADIRPRRLVEYLRDRAGLLIPRGVGVYTFPHRTFQEYLAACHLTDTGYPDEVAALARTEPGRWREVCLLAGAKAARGGAFALWPLVDALCPRPPDGEPAEADLWGALLAGQAIVENRADGDLSAANREKQNRVRDWQVVILNSDLPPVDRALAGDTLAALGDPRFRFFPPLPSGEGPGVRDERRGEGRGRGKVRALLPADPALGFVRIPAGEFWMGSDPQKDRYAYDREQPQHKLYLLEFWIARYPVTVAQWRAFVEATGYDDFDKDALRDPDNHPVRYVTWYNALAYCEWLDGMLKAACPEQSRRVSSQVSGISGQSEEAALFWEALSSGKYRVTLPSEAEWERAARGGFPSPRGRGAGGEGKGVRVYPWGDELTPDHANYDETGLGTTSAVGCFPKGASPYGVLDMSGNVWEWTRSLYKEYPYVSDDGREDLEAGGARVVRGGSWLGYRRLVRAALRYRVTPNDFNSDIGFRVVFSPAKLGGGEAAE